MPAQNSICRDLGYTPVLDTNYRGYHGRGTEDILGGDKPKSRGPREKVRIYIIFASVGPRLVSRTRVYPTSDCEALHL